MANSVVKLSIDSQEYDAKLKSASKALSDYFDIAKKGDRTFEVLDKGVLDAVQAIGKMETQTKSATGQLREMQNTFRDMSLVYRRLSDTEKASPVGKAMAQSLAELKARINDTKKGLQDINQELSGSKFGQFGAILDQIGHKLGVNANITELVTSKTALMYAGIGAGIAVLGKASSEWKKYNEELAKQDQITTVTTGLKGGQANYMTDTVRALADTYKIDFRQAIEAANTLMTQFGKTGDEAMQLLKDGMQGMIQGDGPKMLAMIKQFAPAFRDAGISADKLIAIIHNSEGGLFSEQNMNAILMGIKNIRLMTKQTSDALAQLGIDGQEMSRKMSDGSMTVFEALKQVAEAIEGTKAGSKEAGEVMQYVFGRQGAMQGMKLGRAIAELNTNLEETKKQTGELGDAFADLQTANEHLNTALRETFSYDGWEEMSLGIKTTLIETLADVIDKLGQIKSLITGITPGQARANKYGSGGIPEEVKNDLASLQNAPEAERENLFNQLRVKYEKRFASETRNMQKFMNAYEQNEQSSNWQGLPFVRKALDRTYFANKVNTSRSNVSAEQEILELFKKEADKILNPEKKPETKIIKPTTTTTSGKATPQQQAQAKYEQAQKDYQQALEQAALEVKVGTADSVDAKKKELRATESLWKSIGDAREVYDSDALKTAQDEAAKKVVELGGSVNALVEEQKKAQEAAREMAAAEKKVSEGLADAANAYANNDLKGYISAQKKIGGDASQGIATGNFSLTESNLRAFISDLKGQIAQADLGSELYNSLTAQLADATALGNLMETAIKNGIDTAQFAPQELWKKVFGGGDIATSELQNILDQINEYLKEKGIDPIKLNFNTGYVSSQSSGKSKEGKGDYNKLVGSMSTITGALQQLGVEVPEGFSKTLGVLQVISTIVMAIQSLAAVTATTSALKSIPLIGWFLHNGGVVHAANGFSGTVPGNRFSGDQIPAMLDSGETVLNRAQSGIIASALNVIDNGGNAGHTQATIESDQIVILLQNGAQARGKSIGEYLGI